MKIYTKKGDQGKTQLLDGKSVFKNHIRIHAYGTVDELCCWAGLIHDLVADKHKAKIINIQTVLMRIASLVASEKKTNAFIKPISLEEIDFLEKEIDFMEQNLPPLKNFILPCGHPTVSNIHITRTVCRRTERELINLNNETPIDTKIIVYLNRLSDYFFVFGRYVSKELNAEEIIWKI